MTFSAGGRTLDPRRLTIDRREGMEVRKEGPEGNCFISIKRDHTRTFVEVGAAYSVQGDDPENDVLALRAVIGEVEKSIDRCERKRAAELESERTAALVG